MKILVRRRLLAFDVESCVIVVTGPRDVAPRTGVFHTRQGAHIFRKLPDETQSFLWCLITLIRQRKHCGDDVICLEAGIEMHQVEETAQHKPRADEQHAGEAHFRDNETIAQPALAAAGSCGTATPMQPLLRICTGSLQGGRESEDNPSAHADQQCEEKDRSAYMDFLRAWKTCWQE